MLLSSTEKGHYIKIILSSFIGTKATGNLDLGFNIANITFRLLCVIPHKSAYANF